MIYENVDGLSDALQLAMEELPEPINSLPQPDVPLFMPVDQRYGERVSSLFPDPDVQFLVLNWIRMYAWDWDQLLTIFIGHELHEKIALDDQVDISQIAVDEVAQVAQSEIPQSKVAQVPQVVAPIRARIELKKQMLVAKGKIQSGKTKFMIIMNLLLASLGYTPVFILRNYEADVYQLWENFQEEKKQAEEKHGVFPFGLKILGKREPVRAKYVLYVALSNVAQLRKIKLLPSLCLTMDEVDTMECNDRQKSKLLAELKETATIVLGVSATIMDTLINNTIQAQQIIQLPLPEDYKGLTQLTFSEIRGKYTGSHSKAIDRPENQDLMSYVDLFAQKSALGQHPQMTLITVARCVETNETFQNAIRVRYQGVATILLRGKDIQLTVEGVAYTPRLYQFERKQQIVLPGLNVPEPGFVAKRQKPSIRSCIQWFKNNGGVARFPRIMIIAGEMAGRGISFTSLDYEWHLTEQFFLPSDGCDEPELIQKIRLCGRYRDELTLTLFTTADVWSDLKKADARLEEVVTKVKASAETSKDTIYGMSLYKEKFTKHDMTKNFGTPITKSDMLAEDEDASSYEIQEVEMDPIRRRIQRHLSSARSNNVSIFLASLDPSETYTKEDLLHLLGIAKYEQPKNILPSFFSKTSYGGVGGNIFSKVGNLYKIKEEFAICWNA